MLDFFSRLSDVIMNIYHFSQESCYHQLMQSRESTGTCMHYVEWSCDHFVVM